MIRRFTRFIVVSSALRPLATAQHRSLPPNSTRHHRPSTQRVIPLASRGYSSSFDMPLEYDQEPIVFKPRSGSSSGVVIMLHGLGDTGDGWADVAPMLGLNHIKWILPTAPKRPITLNNGFVMTGWYDIPSLERIADKEDAEGLRGSMKYIESLIDKEVAQGTPSDRIVVAGFSQGGAVSLLMLRSTRKLAGVVGLSTYLPLNQEDPVVSEANSQTPVFMAHGTADMVVNFEFGKRSYDKLVGVGHKKIDFKAYPGMGHSALPEELQELKKFITSCIPPT